MRCFRGSAKTENATETNVAKEVDVEKQCKGLVIGDVPAIFVESTESTESTGGTVKPENATETNVVEAGDVEKQCEGSAGSPVKAEAPRCCSLRAKILSILAGFALLAGAAIVALWPRDPSWNLTNLDVLDESALMFFVMAFGSGGLKNDTALPEVIFRAGATLENPNLIGGTAASGDFKVLYKDKLLGGGQSEPVAVPALGSGNVQADIRVKLDPALFQEITTDVLQNSLHTKVKVRGGATVKSIFGLQLHCRMECDIEASVAELFGETKPAVVESKNCSYKYF